MDFNDTPEEIAWREEYRAWLAENAPSVLSKEPLEHGMGEIGGGDYMTRAKAWQAKKFDAGPIRASYKAAGREGALTISEEPWTRGRILEELAK